MTEINWKNKYLQLKQEYDEFVESSADLEKGLEEELKDVEAERNGLRAEASKLRMTVVEQLEEIDRLKEEARLKKLRVAELEQELDLLETRTRRHEAELDEQRSLAESTLEQKLQLDHDVDRYQDFMIRLKSMVRSQKTQLNPMIET